MQILIVVVVLFLLSGQLGGVGAPRAPAAGTFKGPPPPNAGDALLYGVGNVTGVPIHAIGAAAAAAPTWVKAVELPVAVTAATYNLVRHPIDTTEKAWNTTTHAIEHPVDTAKSAYNTVKSWF